MTRAALVLALLTACGAPEPAASPGYIVPERQVEAVFRRGGIDGPVPRIVVIDRTPVQILRVPGDVVEVSYGVATVRRRLDLQTEIAPAVVAVTGCAVDAPAGTLADGGRLEVLALACPAPQ